MDTPSSTVGPGIGAFIAFFVLALCLWLLMRNMNGRMRRMAYREQQRVADLEASEAARAASGSASGAPGTKRRKRSAQKPVRSDPDRGVVEGGSGEGGSSGGGSAQAGPDDPTP